MPNAAPAIKPTTTKPLIGISSISPPPKSPGPP